MSTELENYRQRVKERLGQMMSYLLEYATGDFSRNIEVPATEDEFTELVVALSLMADDFRELKRSLEIKVAERTIELNEKLAKLERNRKAMLYMIEDLNAQTKAIKEAQEKIIRSEKLATIGQLASSVAHEIRNPLGVMKNAIYYLNMLELGKDNPEVKENINIIASEIERSDKIISDLLEFSRIKQPALKTEDVNIIIKETLNRIKAPADIKIVTGLGEALPKLQADALQLQQVFYNLFTNAIQAMEKGGVLTITSFPVLTNHDLVAVSIKDTGIGIPKENLNKIFEPLFSTKIKGTGLGLAVVASIVAGHGGKIGVESEVGRGTMFTVKLPVG